MDEETKKRISAAQHLSRASGSVRKSSGPVFYEAKSATKAALMAIKKECGVTKTTKHPSPIRDSAVKWLLTYFDQEGENLLQSRIYSEGKKKGFGSGVLFRAATHIGVTIQGNPWSERIWNLPVDAEKSLGGEKNED